MKEKIYEGADYAQCQGKKGEREKEGEGEGQGRVGEKGKACEEIYKPRKLNNVFMSERKKKY